MRVETRIALAAAAAVLAVTLSGCMRSAAIYNVNDAPVQTANGKTPTAAQVRTAILVAGVGLGWKFVDAGPGKLEGTLNLRTHTAVIEVPYSAKSYTIKYKSSENLNEANGTIHSNYNGWVQNLDRAIQQELLRL
jgi:hypothetical protein